MGNRRLTYEDLRAWLAAEQQALDVELAGRVVGRRGKDGETVYEMKARDFLSHGPANAELVADYAGRDRKTILAYRKADWPRSAWLPFMQNDVTWPPGTPEPTEEELEREFRDFIARRFGGGGRHKGTGEILLDLLERGSLRVHGIDASMSNEELAEKLGVSARTISRRRVRDKL